MSSRNVYLDPQERAVAPQLYAVLKDMRADLAAGRPIAETIENGAVRLESAGFSIDYLQVRDGDTLLPLEGSHPEGPARILAAVYLGNTRLIDNVGVMVGSGN
jgi:pantoate--beta-alanine ligase